MSCMRFAWMPAVLLAVAGRTAASQFITVPGNPTPLTVSNAVAGLQPMAVSSSTTYRIRTPKQAGRTYKITAQLNSPMPAGVTLTATMTAAPGATSAGPVTLDGTARDLVIGIPANVRFTGTVTYQVGATVSAGVVPSSTRNVTLTIIRFP